MGVTGAGSGKLSGVGDVHGCAVEHGLGYFRSGACRSGRQGPSLYRDARRGRRDGAGCRRGDDPCRPGTDHARPGPAGRSGDRTGDDQRHVASDRDGRKPGGRAGLCHRGRRVAGLAPATAGQPERGNRGARRHADRRCDLFLRRPRGRKHDPHVQRCRQRNDDPRRVSACWTGRIPASTSRR